MLVLLPWLAVGAPVGRQLRHLGVLGVAVLVRRGQAILHLPLVHSHPGRLEEVVDACCGVPLVLQSVLGLRWSSAPAALEVQLPARRTVQRCKIEGL